MKNPREGPRAPTVFGWDQLAVRSTPHGEFRPVVEASRAIFSVQAVSRFTSPPPNPGLTSHAPHHHPNEELLLVRGQHRRNLDQRRAAPVGVQAPSFFAAHDLHGLTGDIGACCNTTSLISTPPSPSAISPAAEQTGPGVLHSAVIAKSPLSPPRPFTGGSRRDLLDSSTLTFANLAIHEATRQPGRPPRGSALPRVEPN